MNEDPHLGHGRRTLASTAVGSLIGVWRDALLIGSEVAFDVALNTWHYSLSLVAAADIAAERVVEAQRRFVRHVLAGGQLDARSPRR